MTAREPEDLDRLFLRYAGAGDVEGVVSLYEADAVLAFPLGQTVEIARRQPDGTWLWIVDQPAVLPQ